uniref:Uncharacterized protein n=1 Tax=Arundo donax TaxID=35708 RepID=A0A0A8ZUN0_ARUDO
MYNGTTLALPYQQNRRETKNREYRLSLS